MKLCDYVEFNPRVSLPKDRTVPFVSMEEIVPGRRWVRAQEERRAIGSGSKFEPGDTLYARITPCLENGKIAQYSGTSAGMGSTEFFVLRARPGISDPGFVFYFSHNGQLRSAAEKSMSGASGRQRARISALSEFDCEFPSLPVQHRITAILSAYDELMENCERRIRILEEMASNIYRDWFIRDLFPTHEAAPRVDSPLGSIPRGWEVKSVADCIEIDPRIAVPRDGEKPFVSMSALSTDSMVIDKIAFRSGNSGSKFQNGDTLVARITPCLENGKTGFVQFLPHTNAVAFGSTEFIVLRSRTLTPEFVYLFARSQEFRRVAIKSMSGASGRQRVQQRCFDRFVIAHPPRELLDRFSVIVSPNFRLIHQLHLKIQNLRRTRDLLLPRLLSGRVSVHLPNYETSSDMEMEPLPVGV